LGSTVTATSSGIGDVSARSSTGGESEVESGRTKASRAPWAAREAIAHITPSQDRDRPFDFGERDFGERGFGERWLEENVGAISLGVIVERL
jgi:hypothetical protein